ncbi:MULTISPECIES: fibronectin type III domain-containing protein [unclassified Thiocapsa]|uniref:RCC1 domain-containing protein n=1 Tax=unclassified Thiocapsa TaxID=2641286 RepID=UPI0035B1A7EA
MSRSKTLLSRIGRAWVFPLGVTLCLSLSFGSSHAIELLGATQPISSSTSTHAAAVLRERVANDDWIHVRVEVRSSDDTTGRADVIDQITNDVLFAMPLESYQDVQRQTGSPSLLLRVDAAGLDALLTDPSVASVAPTSTSGAMQRISGAWVHSLAIKTDGSLWTWGGNGSGQLGDGTTTNRWRPAPVLADVAAAAAGQDHTIALKSNGSVWTWGRNNAGQLGDGTFTDQLTKVQVMSGVAAIWAAQWGSRALSTTRSLWLWGDNGFGQIGDGTYNARSNPVQVLTNVVAVGAGKFHTLAAKTDRSLWAWGLNSCGQLGDGTTMSRSSPLQVMTNVIDAAAGSNHSLALRTDGSLWAWGNNFFGQLGDGTTTESWSPVQIMNDVVAIDAGDSFTLALKIDGSLWAWGTNSYGQLGDGTITQRLRPVQIMTEVSAMAAGYNYTLALKSDGSLWAWGYNGAGQLGDGTNISRLQPIEVLDFGPETDLPNPPSGLIAAAVSQSQISLSWADNANNELGYRIERKLDTGAWTKLVDVPASSTSYVNTGLIAETTYHYRISAFNGAGYSGYSNEASATTAGGEPICPAETTLTGRLERPLWLTLLDRVRDDVLRNTPIGSDLIRMYYTHGAEVTRQLREDSQLRFQALNVLWQLRDPLQSAVSGQPTRLDRRDTQVIHAFARSLRTGASDELRQDLDRFLTLDLNGLLTTQDDVITRSAGQP